LNGVQAVVLTLAAVASPEELAQDLDTSDPCALSATLFDRFMSLYASREHDMALKRIQIRGPEATDEPNLNPAIAGIFADSKLLPESPGEPWPDEASFRAGSTVGLRPTSPDPALVQRFVRRDVDGKAVRSEDEAWIWSWYTTAGEIGSLRSHEPLRDVEWHAPKDDAGGARVFLYGVVRDGRGGMAWAVREVRTF
jgi:hypothetical protein